MKAISLYQPWASLVALGEKRLETRSWATGYRGPLAIHASIERKFINPRSKYFICCSDPFYSVLGQRVGNLDLPLGAVIAVGELVDVIQVKEKPYKKVVAKNMKPIPNIDNTPIFYRMEDDNVLVPPVGNELAFGDYAVGRYAWVIRNVRMLQQPVMVKGTLGLWEWNESGKEF